jgi:CRP-like cAMP-binding protein
MNMTEQMPYQPLLLGSSKESKLTALQRAEILRNADIFSKATVEELLYLAAIASEVHFEPETTIFREGEIADALYIIIEGKVERIHPMFREVLEPSEVFGLYAVLTGEPRYASAQALGKTYALKIGALEFFDLLSHNTEMVQSLFKLLIQKIPYQKGC